MVGMDLRLECPHCKKTIGMDLGVTQYFRVNGSEKKYGSSVCPECGGPFWFAHSNYTVVDVMKRKDTDRLESAGVICW